MKKRWLIGACALVMLGIIGFSLMSRQIASAGCEEVGMCGGVTGGTIVGTGDANSGVIRRSLFGKSCVLNGAFTGDAEWNATTGVYVCPHGGTPEGGIVLTVINILLYIVGIAAVVMIIVGGIRYATSAGNEKSVSGAKNTIIYALIGLAAATLAYVLVNFVLDALS